MNLLERKKKRLENLKMKLQMHERKEAAVKKQMSLMQRKVRTKKIFAAGAIFEEAGILDDYDHDEVLNVLKKLNHDL